MKPGFMNSYKAWEYEPPENPKLHSDQATDKAVFDGPQSGHKKRYKVFIQQHWLSCQLSEKHTH